MAVGYRLGQLDCGYDPAAPCVVHFDEPTDKTLGIYNVAPLAASRFRDTKAVPLPYRGQYLDLGPVPVTHRYRQLARVHGIVGKMSLNNLPYVRYDLRRWPVPQRGLVHDKECVDVAETRHIGALLHRAAEFGLDHMAIPVPENVTHTLEVPRDTPPISSFVLNELSFALLIEVGV